MYPCFQVVNERANVEVSGAGDFNLMVDRGDAQSAAAAAYLAYDAWGNDHAIVIERLTEDFTDSMGVQGRYSTNRPIVFAILLDLCLLYIHIHLLFFDSPLMPSFMKVK